MASCFDASYGPVQKPFLKHFGLMYYVDIALLEPMFY